MPGALRSLRPETQERKANRHIMTDALTKNETNAANSTNHATNPTSVSQTYRQPLARALSDQDADALAAAVLNSSLSDRRLGIAEGADGRKSAAKFATASGAAAPATGSTDTQALGAGPGGGAAPENPNASIVSNSPARAAVPAAGSSSAQALGASPKEETAPESLAATAGTSAVAAAPMKGAGAAEPTPSPDVKRCSYLDCLAGRVSVPAKGPGKAAFTLLMVGGMVSFMATFNGVLHSGLDFFVTAHWMYPLVFCIAFLVRVYVGDRVVGFLAPRLVMPRFRGLARSIAMTLLNVCVMGTIMGSVITLLLNGPDGYLWQLASTLPVTMLVAALVNFFIVGPVVKMAYHNVVAPSQGFGVFRFAQKYVMPWTAIFGN